MAQLKRIKKLAIEAFEKTGRRVLNTHQIQDYINQRHRDGVTNYQLGPMLAKHQRFVKLGLDYSTKSAYWKLRNEDGTTDGIFYSNGVIFFD